MVRIILIALSAAVAAGLLFVNLYSSIVDAPNWGANLPGSISAARNYFTTANPGHFFRIFSPLNQVLGLVVLILCWRTNRKLALAAFVIAVLADVLTFGYFYPRNEIMFMAPLDPEAIAAAWKEWSAMNWFRSALCVANTVLVFTLLIFTAKNSPK